MQRGHPSARAAGRHEDGFTLIELMMVVLIIAILIAVAIPMLLGARARANDRAAQSTARDALVAAKVVYTDTQDYRDAKLAALQAASGKSALTFVTGDPTGNNQVSVANVNAGYILFGVKSSSGECFYLADDTVAGTRYAKSPGAGGCDAAGAPGTGTWKPTSW
jgi:type IV pilus assembly protein PilA